ncbi:MAG: hypothetical protein Q8R07_05630, partial [Candidatus Uhrbacteria bacterium]|nr:hypothetical protein [Candidatus Uhrbacteria bacterium]
LRISRNSLFRHLSTQKGSLIHDGKRQILGRTVIDYYKRQPTVKGITIREASQKNINKPSPHSSKPMTQQGSEQSTEESFDDEDPDIEDIIGPLRKVKSTTL